MNGRVLSSCCLALALAVAAQAQTKFSGELERGTPDQLTWFRLADFLIRNQRFVFMIVFPFAFLIISYLALTLFSSFKYKTVTLSACLTLGSRPVMIILELLLAFLGYWKGSSNLIPRTAALQFPQAMSHAGSRKLIVFIHGWRGDPMKTWNRFPELVFGDPDFADADVLPLDYPNFISQRNLSIGETASWINDRLVAHNVARYAKVVFITHSIGGLIGRKMILERRPDLKHLGLLVEIATPHLGAANYAQLLPALGLPGGDIVEQVKPQSAFLHELQNDWNNLKPRPQCSCYTSPQDWLVSRESAIFQCDEFHFLPGFDHRELVKPADRNDDRYVNPMYRVRIYLSGMGAEHQIDEFEISMRPYVGVEKVKLLKGLHAGEQIQIQAQVRNSGKTPAIGVTAIEDTMFGDNSIPPRFDMPTIRGNPVDIASDSNRTMSFKGDILSQAMLDEISKGAKTIYFYGQMEYRNSYSSKIYSGPTFCYAYDPDIPENFLGSCGSPTFNRPKKNSK